MPRVDRAELASNSLAVLLTVAGLWATGPLFQAPALQLPKPPEAVELSLDAASEEAPPPAPSLQPVAIVPEPPAPEPLPLPEPPPPLPTVAPVRPLPPPPRLASPKPTPRPAPPRPVTTASPLPDNVAQPAPTMPVPAAPPKPVLPAVPAAPSSGALETGFVRQLRACLQGLAKYPTAKEARLMKPQGEVVIRLTLSREGEVRDVVVDRSSGVLLLDRQALGTARGSHCGRIPDGAWGSAPEHVFTATIAFIPT